MEIIARKNIFVAWFRWYFYDMPAFLFLVWKNYLEFTSYYFSVSRLLVTLFSPWKKYNQYYPNAFSFQEYFTIFVFNLYSRLMGALCRIVLILVAVIAQACILVLGLTIIIFWLAIPCIVILIMFSLLYV